MYFPSRVSVSVLSHDCEICRIWILSTLLIENFAHHLFLHILNGNAFKRAHTFCAHIWLGFCRTVAIMINKYASKECNINIVVIVKCSAQCTLYFVICGDVVTHFSDSITTISQKMIKAWPGKITKKLKILPLTMMVIWRYASCEFPRNVN